MNRDDAPLTLFNRYRAIADTQVRRRLILSSLPEMEARAAAGFLGYLCRHLVLGSLEHRSVYLDLVIGLLDRAPKAQPSDLAVLEFLEHHPYARALGFLAVPPRDRRAGAGLRESPYEFEDVPLGIRKARARLQSRDQILVMTADPDPGVIRILMDNPMLVESDALRTAAMRPQTPANFRVVLESRFGFREAIQTAIVLNPFCPTRVSLAVLPLLPRARMVEVADSGSLDQRVRLAAAELLGQGRQVAPSM
jgi:hypothetical protein